LLKTLQNSPTSSKTNKSITRFVVSQQTMLKNFSELQWMYRAVGVRWQAKSCRLLPDLGNAVERARTSPSNLIVWEKQLSNFIT